MNEARWGEILDLVKEKFGVLEHSRGDFLEHGQKRGERETLIFKGPLGRMKLEFIKKPRVLEKKIHSHRRRAGAITEYVFSDSEFTCNLLAYRWDEGSKSWMEVTPEGLIDT